MVPYLGGVVKHTGFACIARDFLDDAFQVSTGQIGAVDQFIEIGYGGVVMFAVVELKGLRGNVRFQGVLRVR